LGFPFGDLTVFISRKRDDSNTSESPAKEVKQERATLNIRFEHFNRQIWDSRPLPDNDIYRESVLILEHSLQTANKENYVETNAAGGPMRVSDIDVILTPLKLFSLSYSMLVSETTQLGNRDIRPLDCFEF